MKLYLLLAAFGLILLGTVIQAQEDVFSIALNELLSVKCDDTPEEYSDWLDCHWPHGNLTPLIKAFLNNAEEKGCKVPSDRLVNRGLEYLDDYDYKNHPIYKKLPSSECGQCGRKFKCCTKARTFLTQSYASELCDQESLPCQIEPLSDEDRKELTRLHPDIQVPQDDCGYSVYLERALDKVRSLKAYKFIRPLACQIIGTTRPSLNCVSEKGSCWCCCFGYEFKEGRCVPELVKSEPDPDCAEKEEGEN